MPISIPRFTTLIGESIARRDAIKAEIGFSSDLDAVNWSGSGQDYPIKATQVGVLVDNFDLKPIGTPEEDVAAMLAAA